MKELHRCDVCHHGYFDKCKYCETGYVAPTEYYYKIVYLFDRLRGKRMMVGKWAYDREDKLSAEEKKKLDKILTQIRYHQWVDREMKEELHID